MSVIASFEIKISQKKIMFDKNSLSYIVGDFLTKSSGHTSVDLVEVLNI
jgi:hypothetical protein